SLHARAAHGQRSQPITASSTYRAFTRSASATRRALALTWRSLSFVAGLDERSHVPELLIAILAQLLGLEVIELLEVPAQRFGQDLRGRVVVAVGAARRLRNHLVDDAQALQIGGGYLHRRRRLRLLAVVAPQDR